MADKIYVVDTSAIGAWFIHDEFSPGAERLRDAISAGQVQVSCPDFLLLELANLLIFKHVERSDIATAVQTLTQVNIDFIPLTAINFDLLIELATAHNLTSYDALYFALAEQKEAILLSADKALLRAAGPRGLHINDFRI